jgi:hypothetical protein
VDDESTSVIRRAAQADGVDREQSADAGDPGSVEPVPRWPTGDFAERPGPDSNRKASAQTSPDGDPFARAGTRDTMRRNGWQWRGRVHHQLQTTSGHRRAAAIEYDNPPGNQALIGGSRLS